MQDSDEMLAQLQDLRIWDSHEPAVIRDTKLIDTRTVFLNYLEGQIASANVMKLRGSFYFPDE